MHTLGDTIRQIGYISKHRRRVPSSEIRNSTERLAAPSLKALTYACDMWPYRQLPTGGNRMGHEKAQRQIEMDEWFPITSPSQAKRHRDIHKFIDEGPGTSKHHTELSYGRVR